MNKPGQYEDGVTATIIPDRNTGEVFLQMNKSVTWLSLTPETARKLVRSIERSLDDLKMEIIYDDGEDSHPK